MQFRPGEMTRVWRQTRKKCRATKVAAATSVSPAPLFLRLLQGLDVPGCDRVRWSVELVGYSLQEATNT